MLRRLIKPIVNAVKLCLAMAYSLFLMARFTRFSSLSKHKKYRGQTCAVLGNGPSLGKDFEKVTSGHFDEIAAVNCFANSEQYTSTRPGIYFIADPIFWSNNLQREDLVELRRTLFDSIRSKTDWPMTIILPAASLRTRIVHNEFCNMSNIKIVTFNNTSISGPNWFRSFLYSRTFASPRTQNVMIAMVYCCVVLEFDEISLFGADHSWHEDIYVDSENRVCLVDRHFYDDDSEKPKGKPFRKPDKSIFTMSDLFTTLSTVFKSYEELAWFSKLRNVNIVNRSSTSYIDAFDRQ